ncbi:hypothetical protein [Streptomyces fungicidicus]|uniref:hypothetical protein n=1 Tax=Streptomyces fungicidicus TaxID=68203 RepID=UPI003675F497
MEKQEAQVRARLVDWAQVAAVGVAGVGLILSGYSGVLQSQATQDQLRQSREEEKLRIEEQAALFDSRLVVNKESHAIELANYSRRSVRNAVVFVTDGDNKKRVYTFPNVAPCTRVNLDMADVVAARPSLVKSKWLKSIDVTAFIDWRSRPWRVEKGGPLKQKYVTRSPDGKGDGWRAGITYFDMATLPKQSHLPDC